MLPPPIVQRPYNWWTDRHGQKIVAIVAHNTDGTDSRAYLSRGGERPDGSDRKVSIHALFQKDGTCYEYVPDERGANHAGFGTMPAGFPQVNPNWCTLGFELENARPRIPNDPYTDAQLLTMGWWIVTKRSRWGHVPILRHAGLDPTRRRDPVGLDVAEIEAWADKAARLLTQPLIRHYMATVDCPVFESRDVAGRVALGGQAVIRAGTMVEVDDLTAGWIHLRVGTGFCPVGAFVVAS